MIGFNETFTVRRQVWTDDISQEQEVGEIKGTLQQASAEYALSIQSSITKTWIVWCPVDANVQDGDVLENETNSYAVKGVQNNNYGINKHKELILEDYGLIDVGS